MCTLCAHLLTRWINSSEMLLCVFLSVAPELSKNSDVYSGKVQAVQEAGVPEPWNWSQNYLSKRREPLAQRHGVTSQKTWNLSTTTLKTSNLSFLRAIWKFRGEKSSNKAEYRHYIKVIGSDSGFGQFAPRGKSNLMSWIMAVWKWRR